MTTSTSTRTTRKIVPGIGAIVIAAATLMGASQAQAKVKVYIDLGGWGGFGWHDTYVSPCGYYKHKWYETGKFFWKKKYFKCMGWW